MKMDNNKIHHSFGFALEGIHHAIKENRNLKIHLFAGALVLIASFLLNVTSEEFLILIIMIILVLAAEMINTSIEEMVDLITTEHRKEAKAAKDVAAGMVLVVSIGALIVGAYIFLPYIF